MRAAVRITIQLVLIVLLPKLIAAQFEPASPPIADPSDSRFADVKEVWTTPSLTGTNLKPVRPMILYTNHLSTYSVQLVRLQWRFGDPLDVFVMKPNGVKNPPVILYLYSYPEDTDVFKGEDFQKEVTKEGFAAVGFVTALTGQRYHDRPQREWFISELQESLATSAHDVTMVLNYLEKRGDLDMNKVGMYAQGSGASIGILASAVDARIKVLDMLDPWGDWPDWMAKSQFVPDEERPQYLTPDFQQRVARLEPVEWLPKLQAVKVRLQDAVFEINTPAVAKKKLREAVPSRCTVVIYQSADELDALGRAHKELDWIENQLRALHQRSDQLAADQRQEIR